MLSARNRKKSSYPCLAAVTAITNTSGIIDVNGDTGLTEMEVFKYYNMRYGIYIMRFDDNDCNHNQLIHFLIT